MTFATHDLPTFAGWKAGQDLIVKPDQASSGRDRGNATPPGGRWPISCRRAAFAAGFFAVAQSLAGAPSRLLVVAIEDVLGALDQANLPGTIEEHPNWRRRPAVLLEDLRRHDGMRTIATVMQSAGRFAILRK